MSPFSCLYTVSSIRPKQGANFDVILRYSFCWYVEIKPCVRMSVVCKSRIWLQLSGVAVSFPYDCVCLAWLYLSVMIMFVQYDCVCLVWLFVGYDCDFYDSICRVRLCLFGMTNCPVWFCLSCMKVYVRYVCVCSVFMSGTTAFVRDMILFVCHDYLSSMIVFVWYDYLSSMVMFVLYEGICPVWLYLFSVYVRYDCICPIWFCLSTTTICRVWFCLFCMTICPVWLCLSCMKVFVRYDCVCSVCISGMTAFVGNDFFATTICWVWLCLSGMTTFVRVYFRAAWGTARKYMPNVILAIFWRRREISIFHMRTEAVLLCQFDLSFAVHRRLVFNLLKTKRRPLYLKTQSVPRCKHFSSRL